MNVSKISVFWDITFAGYGDSALITGSPNRTASRFLFQDNNGSLYIAEGYSLHKKNSQIRQNLLLEFLQNNQLVGIHPFYRTRNSEHGVQYNDLFWQIRPYIPAGNIPRTTLGDHADHGALWGEFLLQFKKLCDIRSALPPLPNAPFYMINFLPQLYNLAAVKMPDIRSKLQEFERRLAPFFRWERTANCMVAHGDFHPGNILMEPDRIKAVIDWEFAGTKFPGYDMALLLGCLGMDHPKNLSSPAVVALQNKLYAADYLPPEAWELLPQLIAATRLGWLGEWLDLNEKALIEQEIEFISFLLS